MSVLQYLFCTDINRGVREYRADPGAVLLDVRSREEYDRRHIEESVSLPLSELDRAPERFPDRTVPLYVYAYGGETSARAVSRLKKMGYARARDIGGIKRCCGAQGYCGPMVAGGTVPPEEG